jgi:hypothetical protein
MIDALTETLMSTGSDRKDEARAAAEARCHLDRVRSAKAMVLHGAMARIEATQSSDRTMSSADLEAEILLANLDQQLVLDGYERKAASRYRRALRAFWNE